MTDSTTGSTNNRFSSGKTPQLQSASCKLQATRLQKLIANSGYCSRRKAEDLIKAGKVTVNGKKAEIGQKASPQDKIEINGKALKTQKHIYIALNKPQGYLSTTNDTHSRKTVLDLLPEELRTVKPAGRLDMDSEGLIILSTDGDFINHLTHPKYPQKKIYQVTIKEQASDKELKRLTSGTLELDGYKLNPMPYKVIEKKKGYTKLMITLTEGRKRQIREVLKLLSYHVVYLRRVQVGSINLDPLKKGEFRHLTETEINSISNIKTHQKSPISDF